MLRRIPRNRRGKPTIRWMLASLSGPLWDARAARRGDALVKVGEPVWQELDRPSSPSEDERRLMTMLAAGVDEPLLSDQVRTAVVIAVCRCGCSSVRVRSQERPISATRVAQLSSTGRDDVFSVQAFSSDPATEQVYVELHVVRGRVEELEVF